MDHMVLSISWHGITLAWMSLSLVFGAACIVIWSNSGNDREDQHPAP